MTDQLICIQEASQSLRERGIPSHQLLIGCSQHKIVGAMWLDAARISDIQPGAPRPAWNGRPWPWLITGRVLFSVLRDGRGHGTGDIRTEYFVPHHSY